MSKFSPGEASWIFWIVIVQLGANILLWQIALECR